MNSSIHTPHSNRHAAGGGYIRFGKAKNRLSDPSCRRQGTKNVNIDNVCTLYYYQGVNMLITWDDKKNEANFKKHGVWFEEAQTVLLNSLSLMAPNDHTDGDRMEYLGYSTDHKLLYVVTVEKDDDTIRIISARKATLGERKNYEEGI